MTGDALSLLVDDEIVGDAFRIALGDFFGNIQPWRGVLSERPAPCILAGLGYDTPWTRDASLNAWYAASLLARDVAKNTLLAVLEKDVWGLRIGGQYWDAIVWTTGAWNHHLCTNDRDFLATAFEASKNSIRFLEATEFDAGDNLFRGGACFQDGIAGYPDRFADNITGGIEDWPEAHPDDKAHPGHGLPLKALSTNCLYYHAYRLLEEMAKELGEPIDSAWADKAARLRAAVNQRFWIPERGSYCYLIGADDDRNRQEGFGHAFAILFGVASERQCASVFRNQHVTPHGIPCVWPPYDRYADEAGTSFGRHCGTIWPQVNAAWVMATARCGRREMAWKELTMLAEKACRDVHFAEIYHPLTGEIYGGMQEDHPFDAKPKEWVSQRRQTWCATGYIRMVLSTLFGFEVDTSGISVSPWLPDDLPGASLSGLRYREMILSVTVERSACGPSVMVNGTPQKKAFLPVEATGSQDIRILTK